MLSAIHFNLNQSKILSSGKGLNVFHSYISLVHQNVVLWYWVRCAQSYFLYRNEDWWYARHADTKYYNDKLEGYIPRNYVGLEDTLDTQE